MVALLLFLVFGLLFGYFSTLNTSFVSVNFGQTSIHNVPLYMLVLASLGLGIVFATIFYFLKSIGTSFILGRKGKELAEAKQEIVKLNKTIHELQIDNTRLKTETGEIKTDDDSL
jgi:hypothetical protein